MCCIVLNFGRRDSFITHRAFCNALAQESTNFNSNPTPKITSHLFPSINFPLKFEHQDPFFPPPPPPPPPPSHQNPNNPTSSIGFGLPGLGPGHLFASSCPAWEVNNNNNNSCSAEIAPFFHHMVGFEEAASFEEALNGILMSNSNRGNKNGGKGGGAAGEITRDFLGGLRPVDSSMFQNHDHQMINNDMSNLDSPSTFGVHGQNQNTTCWRQN